ncbi:MAG: 30S ribosomal protein S11 [Candidatus Gracilibacteria bacterium]
MAESTKAKAAVKKTKKARRSVPHAVIHIKCSMNNTIVTIADLEGNALAQGSAGASGFRGTRKSTPYAAQVAAENAMKSAVSFGIEKADVFMKGVGVGRDQSLRGIASAGIEILSINDITPVAHGGCRKRKVRRP